MRVGCTGKIRHETWAAAEELLTNLRLSRDEHASRARLLNVYACAHCAGYHIGHNSRLQPARRRGRWAARKTIR